jgi:hypothetical protein
VIIQIQVAGPAHGVDMEAQSVLKVSAQGGNDGAMGSANGGDLAQTAARSRTATGRSWDEEGIKAETAVETFHHLSSVML